MKPANESESKPAAEPSVPLTLLTAHLVEVLATLSDLAAAIQSQAEAIEHLASAIVSETDQEQEFQPQTYLSGRKS